MSRTNNSSALKFEDLQQTHAPTIPHNMEAEQGLLGALFVDNRGYDRISDTLRPEHFYTPVHARLYQAISATISQGQNASPVTLKAYFQDDPDLKTVGGPAYLADLAANVISTINTEDYARTIIETHHRRCLIDIAEDLTIEANTPTLGATAFDAIERAEARLCMLAEEGADGEGLKPFSEFSISALTQAEKALKAGRGITGVTTGFPSIDRKLGGLQPSDLIILAARPSMGKTALALNVAYNAARKHQTTTGEQGAVVAFFSLEMSGDQLSTRLIAEQAEVPSDAMRRGDISHDALKNCMKAAAKNAGLPLYIDQSAMATIATIRSRARRLKRQTGLGLIVVDYLQLMHDPGKRPYENRTLEVSNITRGLKQIAKELNVPVLALSQLSRAPELRDDKRPQLSDLRESGSIEQDADVVIFLYREEYYLSRTEPQVGTEKHLEWQDAMTKATNAAEAIIAKQRHGPISTIKMKFDAYFTRFTDEGEHQA